MATNLFRLQNASTPGKVKAVKASRGPESSASFQCTPSASPLELYVCTRVSRVLARQLFELVCQQCASNEPVY
jgi:hypothetical protein